MARLPDTFIDELLSRVNVVEVIQERLSLKRQGKEYGALCPFHDERSPSFTVSPTKQFYHCFGCGAHGTAISFLMEYDRLEFLDAVEELASRAGIQMPQDDAVKAAKESRAPLYSALARAAELYTQELGKSDQARAYLEHRGISQESIERFGVGFAPNGFTTIIDHFGASESTLGLLESVGLVARNDRDQCYDKFRNRIMFPIHDRRGRVIGFGGRALEEGGGPKYLNSPESPLFHKGRELYGLWHARQSEEEGRLVVVEGYLDVIALAQSGHEQVVATLGTATTAQHAETLFRTASDVVFCFDGDKAGQGAAYRALEAALPSMRDGRQAWFMTLPEGEDPDTIVREGGALRFQALMDQAVPISAYCFRQISEGVDLATLEGRARLAERAKPLLERIPPGAFADLMAKKLSEVTGLGPRTNTPVRRNHRAPRTVQTRPSLVRTAISILLQQPSIGLGIQPPFRFLTLRQPGVELLVEVLSYIHHAPDITVRQLLDRFSGRDELPALQKLAAAPLAPGEEGWQGEFEGAIAQLNRNAIQQRISELNAIQSEKGLGPEEKQELLELLRERINP